MITKQCPRCKLTKTAEQFAKNRSMKDGLQFYCSQCRADKKNLKPGDLVYVTRVRDGQKQVFVRGPNHGESRTPLYRVWRGMKERCSTPNAQNYRFYGGRGIAVCDAWITDFLTFKSWAIKAGYEKGLELDRINNELGYSPNNCRWLTKLENLKNRRLYLPSETEKRLVAESKRRNIPVYVLVREAVDAYLGILSV